MDVTEYSSDRMCNSPPYHGITMQMLPFVCCLIAFDIAKLCVQLFDLIFFYFFFKFSLHNICLKIHVSLNHVNKGLTAR